MLVSGRVGNFYVAYWVLFISNTDHWVVKAILEILYGRNFCFMRAIAGADSVLGNPTRLQKFLVKRSNPIWK